MTNGTVGRMGFVVCNLVSDKGVMNVDVSDVIASRGFAILARRLLQNPV